MHLGSQKLLKQFLFYLTPDLSLSLFQGVVRTTYLSQTELLGNTLAKILEIRSLQLVLWHKTQGDILGIEKLIFLKGKDGHTGIALCNRHGRLPRDKIVGQSTGSNDTAGNFAITHDG